MRLNETVVTHKKTLTIYDFLWKKWSTLTAYLLTFIMLTEAKST